MTFDEIRRAPPRSLVYRSDTKVHYVWARPDIGGGFGRTACGLYSSPQRTEKGRDKVTCKRCLRYIADMD